LGVLFLDQLFIRRLSVAIGFRPHTLSLFLLPILLLAGLAATERAVGALAGALVWVGAVVVPAWLDGTPYSLTRENAKREGARRNDRD
jgi:hypothetical protein